MSTDQGLGQPGLVYGPPSASSGDGRRTAICGSAALFFSLAVFAATVLENHGLLHWHGPEVAALWTCLVSTPVLALIAIIAGIRRLVRTDRGRTFAVIGTAAAVGAIFTLGGWIAYIAG